MLVDLVERLDPSRYRSLVCLLKEGWLSRRLESRGIETVVLPQKEGSLDPGWVFRLRNLLRSRDVDLMHSHEFAMNAYGALASLVSGVPLIATVHGKGYYADRWRRRTAYGLVARRGRMVAVSRDVKRHLVERVGIPEDRVRTIPNGIDSRLYRGGAGVRERVRRELGLDEGRPVVGAVGNLYPVKGHSFLVEAAARVRRELPSAAFLIAGEGALLEPLRRRARELDCDVRFLGFREDVPDLLQALDVFVLPSLSEGLPLSVLEAMAAGRAVVATAVGGIPELVLPGETGLLVPPSDPEALARAILALLRDRDLAEKLGSLGRERVEEEFSLNGMVESYHGLYASA